MKFLIDGSRTRLGERLSVAPELIAGQLLTPLTRYSQAHEVYGIDNGAFSSFNEKGWLSLLKRQRSTIDGCLFVAIPDKVGDHTSTLDMWSQYAPMAEGFKLAFVCQDGCDHIPAEASSIFIGGTDSFKESQDVVDIVRYFKDTHHVHIGRVNSPTRFIKFHELGAHTCDGSGVSRYDHMIIAIQEAMR